MFCRDEHHQRSFFVSCSVGICWTSLLEAGIFASSFMNLSTRTSKKEWRSATFHLVHAGASLSAYQLTLIQSPTASVSSAMTCGL